VTERRFLAPPGFLGPAKLDLFSETQFTKHCKRSVLGPAQLFQQLAEFPCPFAGDGLALPQTGLCRCGFDLRAMPVRRAPQYTTAGPSSMITGHLTDFP
jgi:hypothetical protein